MSRRSQSRRRRNYGRRQHEVRERRVDPRLGGGAWTADSEILTDSDWQAGDAAEDRAAFGEPLGGFAQ